MFFLSKRTKKHSVIAIIAMVVVVNVLGFNLLRPTPVRAFVDVNQGLRNVTDNIGDSLLAAGLGALVNGASYFMRKIAYDTAKYIASGGKGQGALAFQEGFGSYLGTVAADSAFDAIDELGKPFGLNICQSPDVRLQIGLQVSISNIFENELDAGGGPQPSCTYNQFKENWDNARDSMVGDRNLLENFNVSLKTSQGSLGAALGILGKVDSIVAKSELGAQLERLEGGGFKSITGLISGEIKTPAQITREEATGQLTATAQTKSSAEQIAGLYGADALSIFPMALSVFANTLASTLLQNVLEKGLFPTKGDPSSVTDFYASTVNRNRQIAETAFSYLIAGIPQRPLTAYDVVTEYSTCGSNPGLNNCVMDSGLAQALDRARLGTPLTIGEAMSSQNNLLHDDWLLIADHLEGIDPNVSKTNLTNANLEYCHSSAYCISNVEKLRKARILPLGFEIAVMKSPPDNPWKLGDVVRGFNTCDPSGKPSDAYPYCKLIDPNWILKAPEARCEARVSGPELLTESTPTRREECVDFSTCLETDENGQCKGFGYCTKEENIWNMPGQACAPQFNTCKTYVSATDGQIASYLSRTLDVESCSADSIGCRAYSLDKEGDAWVTSADADPTAAFSGRTQAIHFTNIAQCPSSAEGCSLFMDPTISDTSSDEARVFLKKAPDYLQCYDTDLTTADVVEWPQTQAEITKLDTQKTAACSAFAGACTGEEVGCEVYTPANGGASVTGIIGGNSCPTQCVGYETFKQEATAFESEKFPLHFIASNARSCTSLQVGCDEFTNIGVASEGGEALEYYTSLKRCERPSGDNSGVFYSWEGSESQGYQLRRNILLPITSSDRDYISSHNLNYKSGDSLESVFPVGSPAYVEDLKSVMQSNYDQCNQESYNLLLNNVLNDSRVADNDCRALYNSDGQIFYRVFRNTVTVSNSCTPLRKTNSELIVDENITAGNGGQTLCEAKGGVWGAGECKRCASGGTYEVNTEGIGSCVYQSIKAEATSCPAAANGCRSYVGNTGNNLQIITSFGFEPAGTGVDALNAAKQGWSDNTVVQAEALQVGLHSLRVNGQSATYTFEPGTLETGAWYEIRFSSRGSTAFGLSIGFNQGGQNIGNAFTYDPSLNQNAPVSIGAQWQEYRVGPVQFTGNSNEPVQLYFDGAGGSSQFYFLDTIEFSKIGDSTNDHIFRIKNSWRTSEGYEVPLACDSQPNNGLPGEYLGCREYTNNGVSFPLTGFDRLCRDEAVGCRALVDTQNTVEGVRPAEKQAYGVVCRKAIGVTVPTPCSVTLTESPTVSATYGCTIPRGERECRVPNPVVIPAEADDEPVVFANLQQTPGTCISLNGSCARNNNDKLVIDESTVVVKEDSGLIYLAAKDQFVCQEDNLACTRVGLETKNVNSNTTSAYSYQDAFIKNDPRIYADILCSGDEVGCAAFKNDNSLVYFKDPEVSGDTQCVYKDKVTLGEGLAARTYSGWFKDTGKCAVSNQECRADADCGGNDRCVDVGVVPCYENYLDSGNEYNIWSQGSLQYEGNVGMCDTNNNGCTELIDRAAITSSTPNGKSYYALMNDRLKENIGQCEGKVSQKEGCVLFDVTENPDKIFDTSASYDASRAATPIDSLVNPVRSQNTNDANFILKVERDRQCSEWLACGSSITVTDENGNDQVLCQQYIACSKFNSTGECIQTVNTSRDNSQMTEEKYIARSTGWTAPEYSGYSFFGMYNASNFVYLLFEGKTEAYMGYEMSHSFFVGQDVGAGCRETTTTGDSTTYVKADGASCGFDAGGRCYRQRCIYPIEGTFDFTPAPGNDLATSQANVERMLIEMQPGICKAYPESTSPFSVEVAVKNIDEEVDMKRNDEFTRYDFTEKKELYERANVCQPGSNSTDCSCEYLKVEYKNGVVDYWATKDSELVTPGICTGGDNDGNPCATASECGVGSMCSTVKQKGTFIGQRGLCIEYDLSRPLGTSKETARLHEAFACLTWLPIQVSASSIDLNNMDPEAGYYPVSNYDSPLGGGHAYCTESTNRGAGYYNPILDGSGSESDLDVFGSRFGPAGSTINGLQMFLYREGGDNNFYDAVNNPNGVFDSRDQTNYEVDRGTGIYAGLMAKTDTSMATKLKVYRSMQAWAWENIGPSSRILRLDTKGGDRIYYYSEVDDKTNVYGFATLTDVGTSIPNDTGTLMHPPRLFENQGTSLDIGGYHMNPGKGHFFPLVGTAALSPEIGFSGDEELSKFIQTDPQVESSLNEEDLQSVHFVPISFPDGAEGYNPALLTPNVSIDFAALRRVAAGPARAYREDVYAYTGSPSGPGCDGQPRYRVCDSNNRMVGLSYLLERGTTGVNGNGLLSFDDYTQSREGDYYSSYIESSADVRKRSEIHRRYVSFIFSPDEIAFQGLKTGDARIPDINSDPFTAECKFPGGKQNRNWLAIGMDFNEDGEFLGYITRWCMNTNNTDGEANGIRFATIAKMQDRCLEYNAVVDNEVALNGDNNKAWTDRVWINSTYQSGSSLLAILKAQATGLAPYGSLPQSVASAEILRANPTKPVPYYGFPDYDFGVQYQCGGGDGFANGTPSVFSSKNCALPTGGSERITNITFEIARDPKEGQDKLRELFMKYYAMKNFVNIGSLPNTAIAIADIDKSGVISEIGTATRPPQIFSINPYTCSQRGGNCTAAEEGAFTINFRNFTSTDYNNDGSPDEDSNQQDGVDPIVAEGTYYAIANFFAYADDNRMPIKRVTVDWGDNSFQNDSPDGLYKNRKPYCGVTDEFTYSYNATTNSGLGRCVGTQITCNSSVDCQYAGAGGAAVACESPAIPTPSRVGVCRYTPTGPATVPGVACQSVDECQPYDPENYVTECVLSSQGGSDHSGGQCLSTRRQNTVFTNDVSCQQTSTCPLIGGAVANCDLPPLATPPEGQRHFGDAPRACRSQYFEYSHTYQCTSADTNAKVRDLQASDPEAYKRLTSRAGVTPETDICVFIPKVQVLDNWGWCNASLIDTTDIRCPSDSSGKGCYNGEGLQAFCDSGPSNSPNAYTQYKGKIILLPTSE